jgi:hypothetical protein
VIGKLSKKRLNMGTEQEFLKTKKDKNQNKNKENLKDNDE